ncbi:hypothetical protein [Nocardia thailandica]
MPESEAFAGALSAHRLYMDSTEHQPAAKNLLVFYGVGGIGKTTLSERLEQWCENELDVTDSWGPPPPTAVAATCRIDLHRTRGRVDMLAALVSLRRAFGTIQKHWPAFDLAFAAYWEAVRPDEPLPGRARDSVLAGDITESVGEILSDAGVPGAGLVARGVRKAVRTVRTHTTKLNAFRKYDNFEELLQRCSDLPTPDDPHTELIGEIAALLDTDLCLWEGPHAPLVVAFIDTFERILADTRRTDEKTLNELVWRMPNVLFVATGRYLIDWFDDARTNLFMAGRSVWPGLVPGATAEPRQHLIGKLAYEDRMRIIRRAREILGIDITETVGQQLAAASDGLPQYLDLAFNLALNRKAGGRAPITVEDVTGSLNELVLRVLEDVPADEQRVLMAASLFPYFDSYIVGEAADESDGCAQRALARPMIDRRGSQSYPYSMHDAIRTAIRNSDHSIPNGFSRTDWVEAGERGLEAIRIRYESAADADNARASLEALGLAIALVSDQELQIGPSPSPTYADWLSRAIVYGPSITGLRSAIPASVKTRTGQGIADFVLSKTTEVSTDEAVELLTRVFESPHPLRLPAGRHRGYVLRDAGRWNEAIAAFDDLIATAPSELNRYQRILTFATARRFAQALDQVSELSSDRAAGVAHNCAAAHGDLDGYLAWQRQAAQNLRNLKRQRELIEKQAIIYRWQALVDGPIDAALLEELHNNAETAAHLAGLRDEFVARLLSDPAAAIAEQDEAAWIETIDRARNDGEIGYRAALIRLIVGLYTDDDSQLGALVAMINSRVQPRSRNWIAIECLLDSYGYSVDIPATQWLEPYNTVKERWRDHFDAWLTSKRQQLP